jgi:5,10-methylene-tetrahydrofolate dehydrogenase/methenyl tetrahydrofolate cyclohydrolase
MPMPEHLMPSTMRIINRIKPSKDIEAITDENMSKVFFGEKDEQRIPATPAACLHILKEHGINLSGKHCVVANRSRIVGLPLSKLLLQQNATVTMCNPLKSDVGHIVSKADVLFSAVGKYNVIKPEWIKEGTVVVDIGTNFIGSKGAKKMVGDLHFDQVKKITFSILELNDVYR